MPTPEGLIKKSVKEILASASNLWSNWPVPGGYGKSTLDCVGCHRGACFAIETKAPGKRLTPRQELEVVLMTEAGAKVFIVDGGDGMRELVEWLNRS